MKIEGHQTGEHYILSLRGRVDQSSNIQVFREMLENAPHGRIIQIDLSEVEFLGSFFVKVLLEFRSQHPETAANIRLANPKPNTRDLLQLLKLDKVFPVITTIPPCS